MGINVNMDYSTLLGSMSGGASSTNYLSGLSGMLSDYSSIKNGSYGKLVSAYYKKIEKDDSASKADKSSTTETDKAKSNAAKRKQYSSIASDAKNLEKTADLFSDTGKASLFEKKWKDSIDEEGNATKSYDYDTGKIMTAVSDLVKNYNNVISAASGTEDVTTSTRASYMSKITNAFKSELSSIGISVKEDGKLSLDKDKMKESGMEAVKNVMGNRNGYAYQISSSASLVENAATKAASNPSGYSSSGAFKTDYSSILDSFI